MTDQEIIECWKEAVKKAKLKCLACGDYSSFYSIHWGMDFGVQIETLTLKCSNCGFIIYYDGDTLIEYLKKKGIVDIQNQSLWGRIFENE